MLLINVPPFYLFTSIHSSIHSRYFCAHSAAIARRLYTRPGAGIGDLASVFGGRKRNGSRPSKHCDASTSIIRKALQALEKLNLVEKDEKGGRRITSAGQRDLDRVAGLLAKSA